MAEPKQKSLIMNNFLKISKMLIHSRRLHKYPTYQIVIHPKVFFCMIQGQDLVSLPDGIL